MMYVNEMDRAVKWYTGILGFVPNFTSPFYSSLRHDKMGCRLDLHPTEAASKDVGFGPIPHFITSDIDAARAELQKKGAKVGEIRKEGPSPRFMSFWDSEGNTLGLEEHK